MYLLLIILLINVAQNMKNMKGLYYASLLISSKQQ
jgi:hypothetical protein